MHHVCGGACGGACGDGACARKGGVGEQRRTAVEAAAEALWQQRHTERLSLEAATQYESLPLSTS